MINFLKRFNFFIFSNLAPFSDKIFNVFAHLDRPIRVERVFRSTNERRDRHFYNLFEPKVKNTVHCTLQIRILGSSGDPKKDIFLHLYL